MSSIAAQANNLDYLNITNTNTINLNNTINTDNLNAQNLTSSFNQQYNAADPSQQLDAMQKTGAAMVDVGQALSSSSNFVAQELGSNLEAQGSELILDSQMLSNEAKS